MDDGGNGPDSRSSGRLLMFWEGPLRLVVELAIVDDRWQPIGFDVRAYGQTDSEERSVLTARALRRIPFGAIVDSALVLLRQELTDEAERAGPQRYVDDRGHNRMSIAAVGAARGLARLDAPRRGRPRLLLDELELAAAYYMRRVREGSRHPTKDLADEWSMSRSTAAKWVQKARIEHLIPPTRPGVAGWIRD